MTSTKYAGIPEQKCKLMKNASSSLNLTNTWYKSGCTWHRSYSNIMSRLNYFLINKTAKQDIKENICIIRRKHSTFAWRLNVLTTITKVKKEHSEYNMNINTIYE